jgi:hypothetical protein
LQGVPPLLSKSWNPSPSTEWQSANVQKDYTTPNHQDQKRNTPKHIIIKTLGTQNKERILKLQRRKEKYHIKANPLK